MYPHFEIVVIDNASTDRSVEIVQSFNDERIHLYQNSYNVGFGPNLDRAALQARNPFLIMLSSDDLMRPTALREYANVLRMFGHDLENVLLVSSIDVIDGQGGFMARRDRRSYYQIEPDRVLSARLNHPQIEVFHGLQVFRATYPHMSVPGHFCTTLFSKQLYEQVGGYSSIHPLGPDAHLDYKILLRDTPVVFINRPLFAYRIHTSNQASKSRGARTLKQPINSYLFSITYSDDELERAGVQRDEMVGFLVDETCLKGGLEELRLGLPSQAFRYLMFAFASSPSLTIRNLKTYGLSVLLCMGPLGPYFARLLYTLYKMLKPNRRERLP